MNANENTIITCHECGCVEEELFLVDGEYYCADCLQRMGYVECDDCGGWVHEDDAVPYQEGYVCQDCSYNRGLEQCDSCGEYFDETTSVFGRYHTTHHFCQSCLEDASRVGSVFYCEDCDDYYEERWVSSYTTASGSTICEDCYERNYGRCGDCDEIFPRDELYWNDADDCYYCESCHDDHEGDSIHEYSYRPYAEFHGLDHSGDPRFGDPITMGFELEVDKGRSRNDCARELVDAFGEDVLYMKSDSSVDFEIVTHPHTLKAYLNDFDFETLCSIPRSWGYKSHDAGTCGFHIHVGRAQLGRCSSDRQSVIDRIAILMYRMWPALVKFSRRTESQLDRWASAPDFYFRSSGNTAAHISEVVHNYYRGCGRYQALNLCPSSTIEFRLWRGSLQPETLKATLQLTSNIVMFAKDHTMFDVVHASWEDITNYDTCPELESYLKERELESFTELSEIAWLSELDTPAVEGDPKFHEGDTVIIRNSDGYQVSHLMIGAIGTVQYCRPRYLGYTLLGYEYALEIVKTPETAAANAHLHTCEGHVLSGLGYWVLEDNIAPLTTVLPDTQASSF